MMDMETTEFANRDYEVRPVWTVLDEDGAYTDVVTDFSELGTGDVVAGYCVFNRVTNLVPDGATDFFTSEADAEYECRLFKGITEDELIAHFERDGYDFNMAPGIFDQELFDSLSTDGFEYDVTDGVWHLEDESNPGDPYPNFPLDDDELDHDPDAQMPTSSGIHDELDEIDDGVTMPIDDEIEEGPNDGILRLHFPSLED